MPRPKNPRQTYSKEQRAEVLALRASGMTQAAISARLGIPKGSVATMTAYGGQTSKPKGEPDDQARLVASWMQSDSLKHRLLREVAKNGPYDNLKSLMLAVRRPTEMIDQHNVMHLLYGLSKEGALVFTEQRQGAAKTVSRIRATKKGLEMAGLPSTSRAFERFPLSDRPNVARHTNGPDRTDYRTHGNKATGGPIERVPAPPEPPVAPVAETEPTVIPDAEAVVSSPEFTLGPAYPELARLRERVAVGKTREARLDALLRAADDLADLDANAAADLRHRAERLTHETSTLTPLEAEYLAYADRKEGSA